MSIRKRHANARSGLTQETEHAFLGGPFLNNTPGAAPELLVRSVFASRLATQRPNRTNPLRPRAPRLPSVRKCIERESRK